MSEVSKRHGWTDEQEELLAEWSDKALCYRWLHDKSERQYSVYNASFTIPIIVLSTLTGTASVGLDSFVSPGFQKTAQSIVGGVSIFTGILGTLANFLRYAQGMEGHRVASVSWGKLHRKISVELALSPTHRTDCTEFLKLCRAELDRLIEQSPGIPESIITEFEKKFDDIKDVKRPEVCNNLEHTRIFRSMKSPKEKLEELAGKASLIMRTKHGDEIKSNYVDNVKEEIERRMSTTALQKTIDEDLARLRESKVVSKWKPIVKNNSTTIIDVPDITS
ncbi:MAG: SLATT domain-containing protein [Crocinitomicaceae bacterium]|nr:SLATT domain-containing protein [Crocinitomicaceae bacterium]NCA21646.1 SLATT domain-containing protein [Crocinitomicaceae bacterium]